MGTVVVLFPLPRPAPALLVPNSSRVFAASTSPCLPIGDVIFGHVVNRKESERTSRRRRRRRRTRRGSRGEGSEEDKEDDKDDKETKETLRRTRS